MRLNFALLAASTFGRGGILSENRKDGKVTVHSAKNTSKFDSTVGRYANCADQINLGVAAALRNNIYGGVPRATSLTTTVAGGPNADDCAYVEFKVDGSPYALSNSFIGAFQVPSSWPMVPGESLASGDASPDFLDLFRPVLCTASPASSFLDSEHFCKDNKLLRAGVRTGNNKVSPASSAVSGVSGVSFPNTLVALFAANEREAAPVWVAAAFATALFAAAVWVAGAMVLGT